VSPSGSTILVSGAWYARNGFANYPSGADHWAATFDGKRIGRLTASGGTSNDRCDEFTSGLIDDDAYYVLCWTPDGGFAVERTGTDGRPLDRTAVSAIDAGLDGGTQVARTGDRLFLWEPFAGRLSRLDLRTGEVRHASSVAAAPDADPLAGLGRALGRWLAPVALAKVFVDPGLVVAPDGRTVYAIGIRSLAGGETAGSLGVFVFDADSLEQVGHWDPIADYVSLAISADGRSVYAAGQAGTDAAGNDAWSVEASVTVYDAANGSVRAIAGRLGAGPVLFAAPVVR
jgi:hypothetical protein